jgi:hypothetical protein
MEIESNHHAVQPRHMLSMCSSENILKLTDSLHWHVQSAKYKNHNKNVYAYVILANTYSENAVKVEKKTKMLKVQPHREHKRMVFSKTNRSYQKKAVWYCCRFREMTAQEAVALQVTMYSKFQILYCFSGLQF